MQWDMCSLIQFDFSLIWFNLMTITWYPWRHRCKRWLKKISWTVVHTWFRLWYYLCCIWFRSDLLSFSLLRGHIGCWHRHDQIAIVQDDRSYIPWVHRVLPHDGIKLPHILSNTLFNCSSSPNCSPMNHAICDECTLRSLRKACTERTCDSHNAITSLPSVILLAHPWSMLSVFSLLCVVVSVSFLSTQRVSISGKDNKFPRKGEWPTWSVLVPVA